jgi:DNA replication and repair protein RecF
MALDRITLKNFKIHRSTELDFSGRLNFIVGGNGQGKTTILEAIYFLCTTKGFKNLSDQECLHFGESAFEMAGSFSGGNNHKVRVYYAPAEGKRSYFLDGKAIHRAANIIGKFPVVLLTPEDHSLTQGSPTGRRKFIDSILSQASEYYLDCLLDYNKVIKQRSALLSLMKEQPRKEYFTQLEVWDDKLVSRGTEIINRRTQFISEFAAYIKTAYTRILPDAEIPEIQYEPLPGISGEIDTAQFRRCLEERRNEEIRRVLNLTGPHRDDFVFEVNEKNLKTYGSQGQHKTFQVALRFAQFYYLMDRTGVQPVFLLDDAYSELDKQRARHISEFLNDVGQAFITMTDFSNYEFLVNQNSDQIIYVEAGKALRK